jgi:hypothetical protein
MDAGMMNEPLFTVCVMATAADGARARELSLDWVKSIRLFSRETVDEMLPTALSPTGQVPATHYLCTLTLTQKDWEHMQAHKARNNSPVVLTLVGPQEDTPEAKQANRDRWLGSVDLKVVG